MNNYRILAIIGKAGAGKDSLLQQCLKEGRYVFNEIISCTSRPPRENEEDGKNYHFLKKEDFNSEDFLETAIFNDWYYGTRWQDLSTDKTNIGVFNPEGIRNLIKIPNIDVKVIMITAKDKTRMLRQLEREENPDVKEIARRYLVDEEDFAEDKLTFDYEEWENEYRGDLTFISNWLVQEEKRLGK